ncbi:MAG: bifunctional folylpolyglutamate synthase/dihydrofolate synthase [Ruminococcus sp.]|uniref:bifunctional folylpolyglutamate synthase/dihydrofolate synthase n=1 Tax=Ruminococcus sp. TaxID=41978 RepID=UPI002872E758|nr:folylpolyglutamate synthase/dihydrofolate synthase family protein [Ruminococcus sp.]MBQ3285123.1 bifunctional folylpolyglutamate synthase/dihydrofolate synthase [Ruminococcus sp.]
MTYEDSLRFIYSLDKYGSRPGLDRIRKLFRLIPGLTGQKFVHIAGTNGKGSVCAMLSAVTAKAGYKTGMFTSPAVVDIRERIQINNHMVGKETFAAAVEALKPLVEQLNADGTVITEFEFFTALGFYIFKEEKCDIVFCEAGMGGLQDATNLIPYPLCSVITRIDLDHTAFLGESIEAIAFQKAGIIKSYSTAVVAPQVREAYAVIEQKAREEHNTLYRAEDVRLTVTDKSRGGTRFIYRDVEMLLPQIGAHQIDNLRCALAVIEVLQKEHHMTISAENIRDGLKELRHPARFEKLRDDPTVILDGAHNPNGLHAFARAVRTYYPDGDKTLIIGMLADKDSRVLSYLDGLFTRVIAVDINNPRALPAEDLARRLGGIAESVEVISDPKAAYEKALTYGGDIFICGSLYLAREIRPAVLNK